MPIFLQIMLGSAVGGLLRHLAILYIPFPIVLVNIIGSFAIGLLSVKLTSLNPNLIPLINAGLLGGLTTFSSFSLESMAYFNNGKFMQGLSYVAISVMVSLAGCYLGQRLSSWI